MTIIFIIAKIWCAIFSCGFGYFSIALEIKDYLDDESELVKALYIFIGVIAILAGIMCIVSLFV